MTPYKPTERACPICGKHFITAPYHIYVKEALTGTLFFCGWNCMLKYERQHEQEKKNKPRRTKQQ